MPKEWSWEANAAADAFAKAHTAVAHLPFALKSEQLGCAKGKSVLDWFVPRDCFA